MVCGRNLFLSTEQSGPDKLPNSGSPSLFLVPGRRTSLFNRWAAEFRNADFWELGKSLLSEFVRISNKEEEGHDAWETDVPRISRGKFRCYLDRRGVSGFYGGADQMCICNNALGIISHGWWGRWWCDEGTTNVPSFAMPLALAWGVRIEGLFWQRNVRVRPSLWLVLLTIFRDNHDCQ